MLNKSSPISLTIVVAVLSIFQANSCGFALAQTPKRATAFSSPTLAPFIKYLRCEGDVLNQFGESKPPIDVLEVIPKKFRKDERFFQEVWPGTQAEVFMFAGYGAFAVWQIYPVSDKQALLQAMAAAGWKFQREPLRTSSRTKNKVVSAIVATHIAQRPIPGQPSRTSTLKVIEARIGLESDIVDLNGVTVICEYSKPATTPKQ